MITLFKLTFFLMLTWQCFLNTGKTKGLLWGLSVAGLLANMMIVTLILVEVAAT